MDSGIQGKQRFWVLQTGKCFGQLVIQSFNQSLSYFVYPLRMQMTKKISFMTQEF